MITPTTMDAFKLVMMGEEALTQVSVNGFKIDRDYYERQKPVIQEEIKRLRSQVLTQSEIGRYWHERYGAKTNLDSNEQLKAVLEHDIHFDKFKITDKGGKSADASVIEKLPYEFSNPFSRYKQFGKMWGSLITPIILGADMNGFVHPNINLHTVRTYRSSCDSPNLQQVPKHNKLIKEIVRNGFIPRSPKRMLAEIDLQSAEVSVGCCLHRDKQMLQFLHDKTIDMHTFVEKEFYKLNDNELCKELRSSVKGRFVFASFYGAGAASMAASLWEYIEESNFTLPTGEKLKDHMAKLGVVDYDTCLQHTERVFDWYWNTLFKEYGAWKEAIWDLYKKQGYLDYPTGFRAVAAMTKTQAMNTIIQGSTFHLLLLTLIELQKRMTHYKLESKIVCQIHDSIVLDLLPSEQQTVFDLYLDSQAAVRKRWPWLLYPITADADISEVGGTWAHMTSYGEITHAD